ncbi:MoaD/ThiS family protein [Cellulomonas dongxiuzhuiae]|uniref:Molybdopterin synthase sulfur carrier subunit n=1 Tax=Cellulomonas dongxiuzhuiae TaxID=2819979 RepID=A0ABX8GPJ3_9CELL|nr:MoaD/ThiS family protein [Cellulomonas dongxiuzhuiae]MBO3093319.1 MoaD/ThiS family protein [Cellulomonas dongxiuzhuiae]QWC17602.1 MoaD/ThiS family protein [Cellulomonas dongxiuzhuiae]
MTTEAVPAGGTTGTGARTGRVEVRYFAAAAEAAGRHEEHVDLPPGTTVGDLLDALAERHGPALAEVAARCALLVDGVLHRDRDAPVGSAVRVDVLPPFAGG